MSWVSEARSAIHEINWLMAFFEWWVMGAAAPMAPPREENKPINQFMNECSWKQGKGVNEALAGQERNE